MLYLRKGSQAVSGQITRFAPACDNVNAELARIVRPAMVCSNPPGGEMCDYHGTGLIDRE